MNETKNPAEIEAVEEPTPPESGTEAKAEPTEEKSNREEIAALELRLLQLKNEDLRRENEKRHKVRAAMRPPKEKREFTWKPDVIMQRLGARNPMEILPAFGVKVVDEKFQMLGREWVVLCHHDPADGGIRSGPGYQWKLSDGVRSPRPYLVVFLEYLGIENPRSYEFAKAVREKFPEIVDDLDGCEIHVVSFEDGKAGAGLTLREALDDSNAAPGAIGQRTVVQSTTPTDLVFRSTLAGAIVNASRDPKTEWTNFLMPTPELPADIERISV